MAIATSTLAGYQGPVNTTSAEQIVRFAITLSGNYGGAATHGDTLSFANVYGLQSNAIPSRVFVFQQPAAGVAPGNCSAIYCPGTTKNNGVISFANAGTELTQGAAYSGATATAVWIVEAYFPVYL